MNTVYSIDLSVVPTNFDLWHVCLAGAVAVLAILLIVLLITMVLMLSRRSQADSSSATNPAIAAPEPVVKIVEKLVEVEKIVHAPAPEPVILKEASADAALQLLGLLQKEARFIDFIKEDISRFSDADVGMVARVVHEGCNKAILGHFSLATVRTETEGQSVTVPAGFDASQVRLIGNIVGSAPFTGKLIHKGWQVTDTRLPKMTQGYNSAIIAPAEIEL